MATPVVRPRLISVKCAEGTLSVTDALRAFSIRSMVATKHTEDSTRLLDSIVTNHTSKFLNTRFIF